MDSNQIYTTNGTVTGSSNFLERSLPGEASNDFGAVSLAAWSPDGTHVAFWKDGALYTSLPDGNDPVRVLSYPSNIGGGQVPVAWSPDVLSLHS